MKYLPELSGLLAGRVGTDLELVCRDGAVACHAVMLVATGSWWNQILSSLHPPYSGRWRGRCSG